MTERTEVATRIDDDLWLLDTVFQGQPGVIAVYLLEGPAGLALVDVGSAASIEQLLTAIRASGHEPSEIAHLVITHVHLDHAGAAGTLMRMFPGARVYAHRLGAPHLIDPTNLLKSAARIYGDRMESWWGRIEPIDASRVVVLDEGDEIQVGARSLRALYTPGHAVHHLAFYDATRQVVFAGDSAGVRLQGFDYVRPPTPPPDLNLEDWTQTIERLSGLHAQRLYIAHFGAVTDPEPHLAALRDRLWAWGELLLPGIRAGQSDRELEATLAASADAELAAVAQRAPADARARYELATNYLMSAQGYVRYFRKVHPERLT